MSERHRVLSFGGGVQSHALLALLGQGRYPGNAPEEIWFCDPRNERPQTYAFIERVTKPYCARLGVPFVTLERHISPSRGPDIREAYQRRAAYPLRSNRVCTVEWKTSWRTSVNAAAGSGMAAWNSTSGSAWMSCTAPAAGSSGPG